MSTCFLLNMIKLLLIFFSIITTDKKNKQWKNAYDIDFLEEKKFLIKVLDPYLVPDSEDLNVRNRIWKFRVKRSKVRIQISTSDFLDVQEQSREERRHHREQQREHREQRDQRKRSRSRSKSAARDGAGKKKKRSPTNSELDRTYTGILSQSHNGRLKIFRLLPKIWFSKILARFFFSQKFWMIQKFCTLRCFFSEAKLSKMNEQR